MKQLHAISAKETAQLNSSALREQFLLNALFIPQELNLVYTHYDRVIIGGALPIKAAISLPNPDLLKAQYFLERREMGIINVGGEGVIVADGVHYSLQYLDALYLGKGTQEVSFISSQPNNPAVFYLLSSPAHHAYPIQKMCKSEAQPTTIGSQATSNLRTIYKYIHLEGIASCQLVMGLTILHEGNVWNTMPCHTHDRRMEVYFYFNIPENQKVFHFMGQPQETRHLVISNLQAVVSPPWSIHSGCGTSNYGFIWGMAGENLEYSDMDLINLNDLR